MNKSIPNKDIKEITIVKKDIPILSSIEENKRKYSKTNRKV